MTNTLFCIRCGTQHSDHDWPKTCNSCGHIHWKNPIPVATILQPMTDGSRTGLLVLKRAIEPNLGDWSLPGGFMEDNGESAETAALRELYEETGLIVDTPPSIVFSESTKSGQLLIMVESNVVLHYNPSEIKLCSENSDFKVAWEPEKLAFPIHNKGMKFWFDRQERFNRLIWSVTTMPGIDVV